MSEIKVIYENKNLNLKNINGAFKIGNKKIFYKILNNEDYKKEMIGYNIISKYYTVPNMISSIENHNKNIILYEYNENIYKDNGLLSDYFVNRQKLDKTYKNIIYSYKNVFKKTLKRTYYENCKTFFENRINTRLKNNYEFVKKYEQSNFTINNNNVIINVSKIYNEIIRYFESDKKKWCIISQCDPSDLNICIDGMILDYIGGGYVPFMAEFALFFWYNLAQSEYFSPLYNKKSFQQHKNIYSIITRVSKNKNNILFYSRNIRLKAIKFYVDEIIKPILKEIDYNDWYEDFKNYLAMRIMAVFDFKKMKKKDIIISLSFLSMFYNKNINDLNELLEMIGV